MRLANFMAASSLLRLSSPIPPAKGASRPRWRAALAQSVEHIIRNDGVRCSNHLSGTTFPKTFS
jgi:hypothetical protein